MIRTFAMQRDRLRIVQPGLHMINTDQPLILKTHCQPACFAWINITTMHVLTVNTNTNSFKLMTEELSYK